MGVPKTVPPSLPTARGPVSEVVIDCLRGERTPSLMAPDRIACLSDPWSADAQLAILVCQELHYRGWSQVDAAREWDLEILRIRLKLEERFLHAVDEESKRRAAHTDDPSAAAAFDALVEGGESDPGLSAHLADNGGLTEFSDYFAARSIYQLKEADPYAWAIPRLSAGPKAPFAAVQFDEFGGGHSDRVHQVLFADLLAAMGLNASYLGYLDRAPGPVLAQANLITCLAMRRSRLGAVVGHFAATELTSSPGSSRLLRGLVRLDAPDAAQHFYREHVVADAVHEQVVRHDIVAPMIAGNPAIEHDIVAGVHAFALVEDRLEEALRCKWSHAQTLVI